MLEKYFFMLDTNGTEFLNKIQKGTGEKMFREMRMKRRELTLEEAKEVIKLGKDGVLSVHGDDGYPYGVPINYGYVDGKIYIHSRNNESHKIDAIINNPKVCLTVVTKHDLVEEEYTTKFRSAIVFGTARIITETDEKVEAMGKMMEGLAPEYIEGAKERARGALDVLAMIEITPEHITGKESR